MRVDGITVDDVVGAGAITACSYPLRAAVSILFESDWRRPCNK